MNMETVDRIGNWIGGQVEASTDSRWMAKYDPHLGVVLSLVVDSGVDDVGRAVGSAVGAFGLWSARTPVSRGNVLASIADAMRSRFNELVTCVAVETGKPESDAQSEVNAAISQAAYWAGEGMRLHGRSLTSGVPDKHSYTVRQPIGVAGLIVPANTPIANIAWKVFPALICGNTVIIKASEDAPKTAQLFAELTKDAGLPDGVVNVVHGRGEIAGSTLVEDVRVGVISFTGSTRVGRWIAEVCGRRLARVSLELGGKNPLVICDDADIDRALHWSTLSAFSNAGQRCAAGSRLLIFDRVYEQVRDGLVSRARGLKLGVGTGCDVGPVINRRQRDNILAAIQRAKDNGARILCGGNAPPNPELANGFYIEPTVVEGIELDAELSQEEIFGPVVTLHRVSDVHDALRIANSTSYGLTAAIHSASIDRGMWFAHRVRAGVANVNLGTYGSEPHMPFGGFGASGNGTREPGIEALDVYSELKNISVLTRKELI